MKLNRPLIIIFFLLSINTPALGQTYLPLNVMTYNIFQLPAPDWDQDQRAYRLDTAIRNMKQAPDVIVFNEVFSDSSESAIENLRDLYPYQTQNVGQKCFVGWDKITGDCSISPFISKGGVVVVSKYPIEYQHAHIYKSSMRGTWDFMANKGFAYIRIRKEGELFHIFGTHLQATHDDVSDDEHNVRMNQLKEMKAILDGYKIPKTEAVIFAGDMNVEWKLKSQVQDMLGILDAKIQFNPSIHSYSSTKNWLTKLYYRRFGGDASFDDTLDYVLISQSHRQPTESAVQRVVQLRSNNEWFWHTMEGTWQMPNGNMEHNGFYNELSDHYPVQAQFQF